MLSQQWNLTKVEKLFELAIIKLLYKAQTVHRQHFHADEIQLSTLLNIKIGACPENCAYCPQSGHYKTGVTKQNLLSVEEIIAKAKAAKEYGATRFCMGAAWRSIPEREFPQIIAIIKAIKEFGLETCVTLGMVTAEQAQQMYAAGLDFYNHNLDTSRNYYSKIITTRIYQDRLDTIKHIAAAGIRICCGGIIGMGESRRDRAEFLLELVNLPKIPESVPLNRLVAIEGTPLANTPTLDNFEFIRTIAIARIMMPQAVIRFAAGRIEMSEEMHTLCFMAGVNSIFLGDKLLITGNRASDMDHILLKKLGMKQSRSMKR